MEFVSRVVINATRVYWRELLYVLRHVYSVYKLCVCVLNPFSFMLLLLLFLLSPCKIRAFCDASSLKGIAVPLLLFATVLLGVLVVVLPNGVVQSLRLLPANQLLRVSFLILHDRELQAQLGVRRCDISLVVI